MPKLGLLRRRIYGHYMSVRCQWRGRFSDAREEITDVTQTSWMNCLSKRTLSKSSELDVCHTLVTLPGWTPTDILTHILLHGHISGVRPRGRPRKRWADNITEDCDALHLFVPEAYRLAQNRTSWRNRIRNREVGADGACWFINITMALSQESQQT